MSFSIEPVNRTSSASTASSVASPSKNRSTSLSQSSLPPGFQSRPPLGHRHAPGHEVGHVGHNLHGPPRRRPEGECTECRRHIAQHLGRAIGERRSELS